jgi:glycosyltransferase involved in cell wall biosynthesis
MRVLQVDIVVPVRNEERDLAPSIRRLVGYLRDSFPFTTWVTIADNGSTDATWAIADRLARELPEVRAVHLELPGRGRALRAIWSHFEKQTVGGQTVYDLTKPLS